MPTVQRKFFMHQDVMTGYEVCIDKPPVAEVELVTCTESIPLAMATVTKGYEGVYEFSEFTEDAVTAEIAEVGKTQLKDPMAMMHFLFRIRHVTRAFTHQMVRYAVGTRFVQESMRFFGSKDEYHILATGNVLLNYDWYADSVFKSIQAYQSLVDAGIPSEDARGILPTNILTNIYCDLSLLTVSDIVRQRLCCQAQHPEWLPVIVQMRKLIRKVASPEVSALLKAPIELGKSCGYGAKFDRPCVWKSRLAEGEDMDAILEGDTK